MQHANVYHSGLSASPHVGGSGVPLLQKALLSAELALGLLRMKNVDREKAFMQLLQKHLEVYVCVSTCVCVHMYVLYFLLMYTVSIGLHVSSGEWSC